MLPASHLSQILGELRPMPTTKETSRDAASGRLPGNTSTAAVASAKPAEVQSRILQRAVKLFLALVVAGAGAYGLMSQAHYVDSDAAVVTAYVTVIRSPIAGNVHGLPVAAGSMLAKGSFLAHVRNSRANQDRASDLRASYETSASALNAAMQEQSQLMALRSRLQHRIHDFTDQITARLQAQAGEQQDEIADGNAARVKADADLRRGELLYRDGIISRAAYEVLQTSAQIAEPAYTGQNATLSMLKLEQAAARKGVLVEPGRQ